MHKISVNVPCEMYHNTISLINTTVQNTKEKGDTDMHLEFDQSLVTGNEMIDAQHKELIGKIDDLLSYCEESKEKVKAIQILGYLAEYTEFHFAEEEKLQEEISYPAIDVHKKLHAEFRKAIEELHDMLEEEEGPTQKFVTAVRTNVVSWLFEHIQKMDRDLADYVKNQK